MTAAATPGPTLDPGATDLATLSRRIWFVDSLPMTASNKVQKPELRQLAAELLAGG